MKKKTPVIFWFLLTIVPIGGYAQSVIQGRIINSQSEPIEQASITLSNPAKNSLIDFKFSDKDGKYAFSYAGQADSLLIEVAGFNIGNNWRKIANVSQTVDFTVTEQALSIREVIVRAPKIWGGNDTINYSVGAFATESDVVIGDVMKKLPGITVAENGAISYQGKPINKFYIENLDLLQGRYGIATNNISAKDIATVQVMENHQPIRALEGVSGSDQAAINLKLKEGAKGVLTLMALLGGGVAPDAESTPLLWDNSLTAMYFTRVWQNISLYKGNNSGYDVAGELRSLTSGDYFGDNQMLSVRIPSSPSIKLGRYLFNNTHAGSFNNLSRNKKEDDLTVNITYTNDHQHRAGRSQTEYFMSEGESWALDEEITSVRNINRLEGGIRYESNKAQRYLNNNLIVTNAWDSNLGAVNTGGNVIEQRLNDPSFTITDQFNMIHNTDGKGYSLNSSVGFKSSPQNLTVFNGLYSDIFNEGKEYSALKQRLNIQRGVWNTDASLLSVVSFAGIRVDSRANFNIEYNSLTSDIFTQKEKETDFELIPNPEMRNDLEWFRFSGSLGVNLRYTHKRLQVQVGLPLSYSYIKLNNQSPPSSDDSYSLPFFQPSANIQYALSPNLELTGNLSLNNSTGNLQSLYTGYILQDYRNLNRFDGLLPQTRSHSASLSMRNKNLIDMLFWSWDVSYSRNRNNMLVEQHLDDILMVTSRIPQRNITESFNVSGTFSKGFDFKNTTVSLEANYGTYKSRQLRQSVPVDFDNVGMNVKGGVNSRPFSFVILSYQGSWGRTSSKIHGGQSFDPIHSYVNTLSLDVTLFKGLNLKAGYETYYNSAALGEKSLSFTDLSMDYKWKNKNITLTWSNIFNTRTFMTSYYSDINAYQSVYDIRPSAVMIKFWFKSLF
jgi:hypothetical protein